MVHLYEKEQTTDHYYGASLQMEAKLSTSMMDMSRRPYTVTTQSQQNNWKYLSITMRMDDAMIIERGGYQRGIK